MNDDNLKINDPVGSETADSVTVAYSGGRPDDGYTEKLRQAEKKQRSASRGFWITVGVLLLVIALMLGTVTVILSLRGDSVFPTEPATEDRINPPTQPPTDDPDATEPTDEPSRPVIVPAQKEMSVAEIAEKLNPSVVDITVTTGTSMGSGVGMVYSSDGYILTCAHVINGAVSVKVTLYSGEEYDAEIVGYDTFSEVGIVKIDANGLTAVKFGDSSALRLGDTVVAIGSPYSQNLTHTVTAGNVSGIRDGLSFDDLGLTLDVIQHTAPINPGNSGGPLINAYGEVVGMNSIKISSEEYENIGFAIRVDRIRDIITQIIENGSVIRPAIGIKGSTSTRPAGVYVAEIISGQGAEAAGIRVGDIITKIDGRRVSSVDEFINVLSKYDFGAEVELSVLRDVESLTFTVKLSTKD